MTTMIRTLTIVGVLAAGMAPSGAWADAASLFERMDGSFRGRGIAIITSGEERQRVTCQLRNQYDGTAKLKVSGRCATSQGARRVSGEISHAGNRLSGAFLAPTANAQMTKSSGRTQGEAILLDSTFVENNSNKLIRVRQVVRMTSGGFRSDFFTYDDQAKDYVPAGAVDFVRRP